MRMAAPYKKRSDAKLSPAPPRERNTGSAAACGRYPFDVDPFDTSQRFGSWCAR